MRNDLAKITLDGNLGANPELKETPNGKVCKFSIGNHVRRRGRGGENEEHTQWFNVEVWRNAETIAGLLVKGSEVTVHGDLLVEEWTGRSGVRFSQTVRNAEVRFRGSLFAERGELPSRAAEGRDAQVQKPALGSRPSENQVNPATGGSGVNSESEAATVVPASISAVETADVVTGPGTLEDFSDLARQIEDDDPFF